jgi:PiT family inorganic phosphate transporter
VAGNIVVAWVLTIPAAGAMGALTWAVTSIFGKGAVGPLVVSIGLLLLVALAFARRLQQGHPITAEA